jgi:predicted nucleic acid-binding protein
MIVSPQVATEHHSVAQRKLKLPADTARRASHAILAWADAPLTRKEVTKAIDLAQAHQLSWWDSLHIASALAARCSHLLTEDAQSTGAIEGLVFLDPFAAGPDALGLGF